MIKEALIILSLLIVGLIVGLYLQGVSIIPILSGVTSSIGNALSPLRNLWSGLPNEIKGILQVISIPSIISGVFLAITKIKAMQKLNEVEQQTSEQIIGMKGEVVGTQESGKAYSEAFTTEIKGLVTELETKKTELETQIKENLTLEKRNKQLDDSLTRLETERSHLNNRIKSLEYDLGVEKGEIKLPVR